MPSQALCRALLRLPLSIARLNKDGKLRAATPSSLIRPQDSDLMTACVAGFRTNARITKASEGPALGLLCGCILQNAGFSRWGEESG